MPTNEAAAGSERPPDRPKFPRKTLAWTAGVAIGIVVLIVILPLSKIVTFFGAVFSFLWWIGTVIFVIVKWGMRVRKAKKYFDMARPHLEPIAREQLAKGQERITKGRKRLAVWRNRRKDQNQKK